jgi:hypothetical protein
MTDGAVVVKRGFIVCGRMTKCYASKSEAVLSWRGWQEPGNDILVLVVRENDRELQTACGIAKRESRVVAR